MAHDLAAPDARNRSNEVRMAGRGMRLTPAQIAVHLICGNDPSRRETGSMRQQLRAGREMLRSITGQDFGFDLQKWHDYLKESKDGGYTWNRSIDLPKVMKAALANQQWLATVSVIESAADKRTHRSTRPGGN